MSKTFRQLVSGECLFLVGSPEFITQESVIDSFSLLRIKTTLETLDGKRNPLTCISGDYIETNGEETKELVSYFTAGSMELINGRVSKIRIDRWSDVYEKTVSEYQTFLVFEDITAGLQFLDTRLKEYLNDLKESEKIYKNEARKQQQTRMV